MGPHRAAKDGIGKTGKGVDVWVDRRERECKGARLLDIGMSHWWWL